MGTPPILFTNSKYQNALRNLNSEKYWALTSGANTVEYCSIPSIAKLISRMAEKFHRDHLSKGYDTMLLSLRFIPLSGLWTATASSSSAKYLSSWYME